jgi:hypothetical protein
VGKVVGGRIGLNGQLEFCHCLLSYGDFQCHIADGNRVGEPALDFCYSVAISAFGLIVDVLFDLLNCEDDIVDVQEYALPSDHVADPELYALFLFKHVIDLFLVEFLLVFEGLFESAFELSLNHFIFEQHFLLDSDQGFAAGVIGVEL